MEPCGIHFGDSLGSIKDETRDSDSILPKEIDGQLCVTIMLWQYKVAYAWGGVKDMCCQMPRHILFRATDDAALYVHVLSLSRLTLTPPEK